MKDKWAPYMREHGIVGEVAGGEYVVRELREFRAMLLPPDAGDDEADE